MFTEGRGSELIYGVADYWVSRVSWNPEDQSYHLLGQSCFCVLEPAFQNAPVLPWNRSASWSLLMFVAHTLCFVISSSDMVVVYFLSCRCDAS